MKKDAIECTPNELYIQGNQKRNVQKFKKSHYIHSCDTTLASTLGYGFSVRFPMAAYKLESQSLGRLVALPRNVCHWSCLSMQVIHHARWTVRWRQREGGGGSMMDAAVAVRKNKRGIGNENVHTSLLAARKGTNSLLLRSIGRMALGQLPFGL